MPAPDAQQQTPASRNPADIRRDRIVVAILVVVGVVFIAVQMLHPRGMECAKQRVDQENGMRTAIDPDCAGSGR